MITLRSFAVVSAAFLLSGCFFTGDEPFSLDSGSELLPSLVGSYRCNEYDGDGKKSDTSKAYQLVVLDRNKKVQYSFALKDSASAPISTFHLVKEGTYVYSQAMEAIHGEILSAMRVGDKKMTFFMYTSDPRGRAKKLAAKYNVVIKQDNKDGAWNMSGPLSGEKSFILELASDLSGWKMFGDCMLETPGVWPWYRYK